MDTMTQKGNRFRDRQPTTEPGRSVGQLRPCISPTARLGAGRSVGAHRVRNRARAGGQVGRSGTSSSKSTSLSPYKLDERELLRAVEWVSALDDATDIAQVEVEVVHVRE
jgi:hypothetical protein